MARINVYLTIPDDELDRDFADLHDLETSLRARLEEFYDGDGNPVFPKFVGIDVDED